MSEARRVLAALRRELSAHRVWQERAVVISAAVAAGLAVVAFTALTDLALHAFFQAQRRWSWLPLIWTPLCTAGVVWCTRRFAPGAAGSGIQQVITALEAEVPEADRPLFVSLRLSLAKMLLTTWGLLGGLSLGREGPSVQIAAGVMHVARRFLPARSSVTPHGLLVAGGAAGIAAAFNTPLGGVMFAIEELSRTPEQRSSGLLVASIAMSGVIAISFYGNATYFGTLHVPSVGLALIGPGLLAALLCGLAGGLFARLLIASLAGSSNDRFTRWRAGHPVRFAAGCGLAVAVLGLVTHGTSFGSGYAHTRAALEGLEATPLGDAFFRFISTWLTTWSGVPGGIFAPSLAIGGALGKDVAWLTGSADQTALMALGMAGFLAAVTQAPLTSFIIVMEMVDGHAMVISLMASALIASGLSRLLSPPLYHALSQIQLKRLPVRAPPREE